MLDPQTRSRLGDVAEVVVAHFNSSDWQVLGLKTGCTDIIQGHGRLLRSLSFGDEDYEGNAIEVIFRIAERDPTNAAIIESVVSSRYSLGENVSTAPSKAKQIVFTPSVFDTPDTGVEPDLVAAMMPFSPGFEQVFARIASACRGAGLRCVRAKDIWDHQTVIQDIFSLIFRSRVVVCDFTGKNPNVFYEAGIAHTLGKIVIPLTQSAGDIPFDVQHHRYLHYLNNDEGRMDMERELHRRLTTLSNQWA